MKKELLLFASLLFSFSLVAQISGGQISDFEDGTTQGWSNGGSSPNPPTNIPTGGPNGADDNFLEEISAGGGGAGSKLLVQNDNLEWSGDWLNNLIVIGLQLDCKNAGASDLNLRIGFEGGPNNSRLVTNTAVVIPTSSTDWDNYFFDIFDSTVVSGPDSQDEILSDVREIRIISNPDLSYNGEAVAGVMHLDNIEVIEAAGVDDVLNVNAKIFPNPVTDILNLSSQIPLNSYEIYNVLGSLVKKATIGANNASIDVTTLKSGMYMIKLNTDNSSVTKRFVVSN